MLFIYILLLWIICYVVFELLAHLLDGDSIFLTFWHTDRSFNQWLLYLTVILISPVLLGQVLIYIYQDFKSGINPFKDNS